MTEQIRCASCDLVLLAFQPLGTKPINRDDCPKCGGSEFEFVEQ